MIDNKIIGITGGIGSGKSTVLKILHNEYNAFVIEADKVGHIVISPGENAYKKIINEFGNEILLSDNTIDRKKLGAVVFNDKHKLNKLNSIIHPEVKAYIINYIDDIRKHYNKPLIFIEAALLIEDKYDEICDLLWYIYTDKEIRYKRVSESRNMTREKFNSIVNNQLSDEIYKERCDVIIDNSLDLENTKTQIYQALNLK